MTWTAAAYPRVDEPFSGTYSGYYGQADLLRERVAEQDVQLDPPA